jgi:hypothetical protein
MKHFAEVLIATLVVSVSVFIYAVIQIAFELITSEIGYVLVYLAGCATPFFIYYMICSNRSEYASTFNTTMGRILP